MPHQNAAHKIECPHQHDRSSTCRIPHRPSDASVPFEVSNFFGQYFDCVTESSGKRDLPVLDSVKQHCKARVAAMIF